MQSLRLPHGLEPAEATYKAKVALVGTALRALGPTFELVSELSEELQAETADWEVGRVVGMGVLPHGPAMSVRYEDGRFRYLGARLASPTVALLFKNVDAAVLTLTGQIAAHTASIQHRVVVHGNIAHAMQAVRAMDIVQKFLMPAALLNLTAKRRVRLSPSELGVKARVMLGLVPRLAMTLTR